MFFVSLYKGLSRLLCSFICCFAALKKRLHFASKARWLQLSEYFGTKSSEWIFKMHSFLVVGWWLEIAANNHIPFVVHMKTLIQEKKALIKTLMLIYNFVSFSFWLFVSISVVSHIQEGSRWYRNTRAICSRGQILHRVPSSATRRSDHPWELSQPGHTGDHPSPGKLQKAEPWGDSIIHIWSLSSLTFVCACFLLS